MHKNLQISKTLVYSLCFAVLCALFFVISMFINQSYFEAIAYDSVFLYQLRQLAAIAVLFGIGVLFLCAAAKTLSPIWILCFSFPVGCCIWVFISLLLLLLGIPYTFCLTMGVIAALLLLVFFVCKRRKKTLQSCFHHSQDALALSLFFFSIACIASSGFVYSFVSYDSFFYFTNYGHTLAVVHNFKDIVGANSFTLTNISQFLPLLNAYTSFWGLDQCYQIQAFMTANIAVCFAYGLYQCCLLPSAQGDSLLLPALSVKRRALLYTAVFTLLLLSSTSFIVISTWVLANMYCMAYLFMAFLAFFLLSHLSGEQSDCLLLISLFLAALTLLRKDGIIFAAFLLICFCSAERFSKKQLAFLFLPAAASEAVWLFYVRIILDAKVSQATYSSIANNKNIFFVCCIILGSYCYILFVHDIFKWIEKNIPFITEYLILFAGMFLLFIASFILKDANTIIDNVDFVIRNMFRYPSSWGISGFIFGILLVLSVVKRFELDYFHFVWSGYAFLNLISYCIVDSKWFWLNWDDSYNRVLLQIVPVFVFIMAVKLLPLLRSYTPDHSSGS